MKASEAKALTRKLRNDGYIVVVIMAVITNAKGAKRIAMYDTDFGDGKGIDFVNDFVEGARSSGKLARGESMEIVVKGISDDALLSDVEVIEGPFKVKR